MGQPARIVSCVLYASNCEANHVISESHPHDLFLALRGLCRSMLTKLANNGVQLRRVWLEWTRA